MRLTIALVELREACIEKCMREVTKNAAHEAILAATPFWVVSLILLAALLPYGMQLWGGVSCMVAGLTTFAVIFHTRFRDDEAVSVSSDHDTEHFNSTASTYGLDRINHLADTGMDESSEEDNDRTPL